MRDVALQHRASLGGAAARLHLGRAGRVALLALAGLLTAGPGLAVHATALAYGDAGIVHVLGAIVGLCGLVCLGLAFRLALAGRRWFWKLLAVPVVLVLLQFYAFPMVMAGLTVNAPRGDVMPAAQLHLAGARDVSFRSTDGVDLAGWYVPGRSRAAVILAHGSHNTREDALPHLRMLHRLGYGVLAFDARGHGESSGTPNALGWRGVPEIVGAARYLRSRGVDAAHAAVLGLSMGGEEALRAASRGAPVAAVVADGAGASTTGDDEAAGESGLGLLVQRLSYRAASIASGTDEPPALADRVGRARVPVLLIASGRKGELDINRALEARIGSNATLWSVPDAEHTRAATRHPDQYRRRLASFLGAALHPSD